MKMNSGVTQRCRNLKNEGKASWAAAVQVAWEASATQRPHCQRFIRRDVKHSQGLTWICLPGFQKGRVQFCCPWTLSRRASRSLWCVWGLMASMDPIYRHWMWRCGTWPVTKTRHMVLALGWSEQWSSSWRWWDISGVWNSQSFLCNTATMKSDFQRESPVVLITPPPPSRPVPQNTVLMLTSVDPLH